MSIVFESENNTFTLSTRNTTYQMQIGPLGHLLHLYYGRRAEGCFDYLYLPHDCGFSPNPYELREGRGWSLDTLPQEYSGSHTGDFRLSSLELATESGANGAELRFSRYEIRPGKYAVRGMPSAFDRGGEAQTLSVTLADDAAGIEAELLYAVYEAQDVITRAVRITNTGSQAVVLKKAASVCLDIPFGAWDLVHFHGRHTMERQPERVSLLNGIQTIASGRGASSHQHNPFTILCARDATEDHGACYGLMPVYSGNHRTEIELDQMGAVRAVAGAYDAAFSWRLAPGERFDTPETIFAFTDGGLTALSQIYHRFLRQNVCRSRYIHEPRPVLLNSWEAAYFDIDAERLLGIARGAAELGADMIVLDDGWFGKRGDDKSSLGDWFACEAKFPGGLGPVVRAVHAMGLKFGLWVEPEMISEDSELFRAHPDWALTAPGRKPVMGRDQLVLDLSRADVADWLFDTMSGLLSGLQIDYIKWDMNRSLAEAYSRALPPERQGEVSHRYMLGLYALLERLTTAFPDVLFEGCAGGGGRFDAGMLAYFPQIWCSDNSDPIARLRIQRGTSFGYPTASVGAHVSASPNHQTGRATPLGTRAAVAMAGTFGLELDPTELTAEEKAEVREQIARFRAWEELIREGDYYRLAGHGAAHTAWQIVSPDRRKTLLTLVVTEPESNPRPLHMALKGLDPAARYRIAQCVFFGCRNGEPPALRGSYTGAALMNAGYTLPSLWGDYPGVQLLWEQTDDPEKDNGAKIG